MSKLLSDASAKWLQEQRKKPVELATRLLRTPFVSGAFGGWRQWHVTIADNAVRVRSGALAWGGGHSAVWPSGDYVSRSVYGTLAGEIPAGETRLVIWYTTKSPCPVKYCPKHPATGTEDCPAAAGDPDSFQPSAGNVILAESAARQTGWTDCRILAVVSRSADGADYIVNQIQTAEIAVHAIARGEPGEEDDTAPPCGHPGNDLDDDHPGDAGSGGGYYTPGGGTGHPGDDEGENGATPECGSESTEIDPFAD